MPAETKTGQWFTSDAGVRWFFDAGSVGLDFAYLGGFTAAPTSTPSTDVPGPGPGPASTAAPFGPASGLPASGLPGSGWDGLLLPADLDGWLRERFDGLAAETSERELVDARSLRDAIARLALAAADGHVPATEGVGADDIDTLNLFAALPDVPPSLAGGRRQAGAGRLRITQALSSIARDAVALFAETGFAGAADSRLRRCAADDCRLVFVDESRAGTRRWCSMQKCGNRAKVRAHRARAAAAASASA
ncbi:CGNR zinc finger domain-containing protein [Frondihabitans cladoniiphilus]|uniref:Zinc finger CGNR domain-containing protein n=1 Tax=Frondihabitans cladoniiphilus TaxID=715785 RepID=A0ABP8VX20_9MICO